MSFLQNWFRPKQPLPTQPGTKFKWIDDQWVEVCDTCGGNCGQCGWSVGHGVPASMTEIITSLHK